MIKDFTNVNPNDFTQKDLMLHLLQVSQHTVTREEVKEDISQIDKKLDKLDDKISKVEMNLKQDISKLDDKVSKVEMNLKQDISKLDDKISKVEMNLKQDISKLDDKISKVDAKFDKIQWLIIATMVTVLSKDYIFYFIQN